MSRIKDIKYFPCGHLRKEFYEVTRKVFSKKLNKIELKTLRVCKACVRKASNKHNLKYIKRKTDRRWKLVNGKRVFYKKGKK